MSGYATCPICKGDFCLTKLGRLRTHRSRRIGRGKWCKGSGRQADGRGTRTGDEIVGRED